MEEPQLKYRIGWVPGLLVASISAVVDVLQILCSITGILVIVSEIATVATEGFTIMYFAHRGVKFMGGKRGTARALSLFGETATEMIPFVNDLPMLTPAAIYQIHTARADDRDQYKELHAKWVEEMKREEQKAIARAQAAVIYQQNMNRIQEEARMRREAQQAEEEARARERAGEEEYA